MYFLLKLLSLCRVKSTINAVAFGPLIDSLKEQKTLFHQLVNKTLFKQIIFSYNKTLIGIDLIQHAVNYTLDSASLLIC